MFKVEKSLRNDHSKTPTEGENCLQSQSLKDERSLISGRDSNGLKKSHLTILRSVLFALFFIYSRCYKVMSVLSVE